VEHQVPRLEVPKEEKMAGASLYNSRQILWGDYVSMNEMGETCGSFERY